MAKGTACTRWDELRIAPKVSNLRGSVHLAWLLSVVIQFYHLTVPWWADAPSVMGIFALLYRAFDNCLWRWPVWRRIGLVKVPDLSGEWVGYCTSSFEKHCTKHPVTINIQQTWTNISVLLMATSSHSHSLSASIILYQPGGTTVTYMYQNDPKSSAIETMHSHRGTSMLTVFSGDRMEGEYYTGRDRASYGSIVVQRRSNG